MKKIKLTEKDLSQIVKKIVGESEFSLEPFEYLEMARKKYTRNA